MRTLPFAAFAAPLAAWVLVVPANAQVRDCSYNLVSSATAGSYLTVTSVGHMSCAQAKRRARRARLSFSPPSMRLSDRMCRQYGTAGVGADAPAPLFRCTSSARAFRASARP